MQKMNTSGRVGLVATTVLAAMVAFSGAKAGVIPKSSASTFYDNVPGLSLAPNTLSITKNAKGKGSGVFLNCKLSESTGVHAMRVVTPTGLAIHELGVGAGSRKLDVGFAVDEIKGEQIVIGGMTFRVSSEICANAVIKSGNDGNPTVVLNTNIALWGNLGISGRVEAKEGQSPANSIGADANLSGFLPSASVTVNGTKTQLDANVWTPKIGPDGKARIAASIADIGGGNEVKVQLRISL
ncbi:MAG: hypothetical protein ABIF01_00340 [Candidatus Micrarchaeota archaeon]